jgi:NADP-dependent 3-hydroxy acid dehydrogenase YdfG
MKSAFSQQIGLVTGSTGYIGAAIASALAAGGAKVFLGGRNPAKLAALATRLRGDGFAVEPVAADLTQDSDLARLADRVADAHSRLDILVHCAGAIVHGKLEEAPIESLDLQYAANVRGPYLLTKKLLPLLKLSCGQIVFINSSAGLAARAGAGQYSATQHAIKAIADALREEVNADQVRVLSLHPGRTATPRTEALHAKEGRPYRPEVLLQPEDVASVVLNALALPWTAEVTSISLRPMQKSY